MEPKTKVTQEQIKRWRGLAEQASKCNSLLMTPNQGPVTWSIITADWETRSSGSHWQDGAFQFEARQAVLEMAADLELLRDYAAYVADCVKVGEKVLRESEQAVLPMTFEEWLLYRVVEQAR